jgi:hypothetical protein
MTGEIRNGLSDVALDLAQAVQQGDSSKVQGMTIGEFSDASAFAPTMILVRSTSSRIANDTLRVTQIYELDASGRGTSDTFQLPAHRHDGGD